MILLISCYKSKTFIYLFGIITILIHTYKSLDQVIAMTKVMTPKKKKIYAETRLSGVDRHISTFNEIQLHNGVLPSQLEQFISKNYGHFSRLEQPNGREPMYHSGNTLFIPQYSGFARAHRYKFMIDAYIDTSGRNIIFRTFNLDNSARKKNNAYDNNAYDFVVGMFVPDGSYEDRRVFKNNDIKDITKIIFGSTNAVAKNQNVKVIETGSSEYLDAQIVEIDGERVLNLGYVYGDQAGILLDKILREYEGLYEDKVQMTGLKQDIDVYMFGRVGGLEDDVKRHDLICPVGIIEHVDMNEGRNLMHPIHNVLASMPGVRVGYNYNVYNVIEEAVDELLLANKNGCICVEMETSGAFKSMDGANGRYCETLNIPGGFVGNVSDRPLHGDTIEKELDSDKGEQRAVQVIVDYLIKNKK
jgi:hypothetical protein